MKSEKLNRLFEKDVAEITKKLKEEYHPEKIILFGSAARGEVKPGSDIDYFIVKNSKNPRHRKAVDIFYLLSGLDREYPVDFIVFTPSELKQRLELGDFFVKNILEEGKILYERRN